MANDNNRYEDIVERRRFVELMGISGVVALAGCLGSDSDESTATPTGESEGGAETTSATGTAGESDAITDGISSPPSTGEGTTDEPIAEDGPATTGTGAKTGTSAGDVTVHDATYVGFSNQVPKEIQWNTSNPSNFAGISDDFIFDQFTKYNLARNEFVPYAISEWNYGGDTFEMTLRDGLTWSNGDEITAIDLVTKLRLGRFTGLGFAEYTESIEKVDERTVRMNFDAPVNETIIQLQVLTLWLNQPDSVFGEYLDRIEKNEKEGLTSLQDFAWKEPIAGGPWTLADATSQRTLLERREDHPDSGNINFNQYSFRYLDGNQAAQQALINKQIDSAYSLYTPSRIVKQYPETVQQVKIPAVWGYGLVPNHEHKHVGDRAVRQAIQHVIDRTAIANNISKDSKTPAPIPTGVAPSSIDDWLGDVKGDFETYGVDNAQTDRATQVLKDAGYSKSGGKWNDSDGNTVSLPITVPTGWSDWNTATQTVVDQLNSFGFDATLDGRKFGTISGNVWSNGNFVLTAGTWLDGAPTGSYPYFSLHHQMIYNDAGYLYNYPPANEGRGGSNADITVPGRGDSEELTVNPSDRLATLSKTTDDATIEEITVEQAWVANQDLPMLPVIEKVDQSFLTGDDEWTIPEEGAEISQVHWPGPWLIRQGELRYVGD